MSIGESTALYLSVFLLTCFFTNLAENKFKHNKKLLAFLLSVVAVMIPSVLAGLRDDTVGKDVLEYAVRTFELALKSENFAYMKEYTTEPLGYSFMAYITSRYFENTGYFLFVSQLMVILPVYMAAYKFRKDFPMWLPICTYMFLFYNSSFNIMKQSISCAWVMLCYCYIKERRWIKATLVFMLSMTFHNSAFIGLLFLLIAMFINRNEKHMSVMVMPSPDMIGRQPDATGKKTHEPSGTQPPQAAGRQPVRNASFVPPSRRLRPPRGAMSRRRNMPMLRNARQVPPPQARQMQPPRGTMAMNAGNMRGRPQRYAMPVILPERRRSQLSNVVIVLLFLVIILNLKSISTFMLDHSLLPEKYTRNINAVFDVSQAVYLRLHGFNFHVFYDWVFRILFVAVPILSLRSVDKSAEADPNVKTMALIGAAFYTYMLAMFKTVYGARISVYCDFFQILLLPMLYHTFKLRNWQERFGAGAVMVGFMMTHWYVMIMIYGSSASNHFLFRT